MPQRAKGPRLYLDPVRKTWIIRDGPRAVRTSCLEGSLGAAEKQLAEYIARKHRPARSASPPISDILLVYGREHVPHKRSADKIEHTIANLERFWGDKMLTDVTARNCQAYIAQRPQAAARRDLETLRAAIGHWHKHYGPLPAIPAIVMPERSAPRDRWLTRQEAARLLWAARRTPHLVRFILIGLYTGTRSGAILALQWEWIDLERGTMRRKDVGERDTNKRRPIVRLGTRLLSHLRRWRDQDFRQRRSSSVVHYDGRPVRKLRRSWAGAVRRAALGNDVTPHTLRHTRATWMMQKGVPIWQAAGALGMTVQMLERTYGHHHPDWQREAANA